MSANALHYLSLMDVSAQLKHSEITSVSVTESLLARIARHDAELKSYTTLLADRALARAHQADAELQRGFWRGPLHGVPLAVKDLCYTVYAPTARGMYIHKDFVPKCTATVVERLDRAGAIMLGKLSVTEGAYVMHHPKMPTPLNPWNTEIWTGSSSSGSAAATAAGLCYASLGSDTGGSIRYPSAACGLTGLKPTWGRVSRWGISHLAESFDHVGPMARTAADCAAVLSVIAGADPLDPTSLLAPVPDYLANLSGGIRGLRVGIDESYAFSGVDAVVVAVLAAAKDALSELGARTVPMIFPPVDEALTAWARLCSAEMAVAHEETYPSRAAEYGPALSAFLASAHKLSAMDLAKAGIMRGKFAAQVAAVFEDIDVLLVPVMKTPTPTPGEWAAMIAGDDVSHILRHSAEFNFTGYPAITLNGGFDRRGSPIGFQLVGKHLAEDLLLHVGHSFRSITDWHTRHPVLN